MLTCLRCAAVRKEPLKDAALLTRKAEIIALRDLTKALGARVNAAEAQKRDGQRSPDLKAAEAAQDAALGLMADLAREIAVTPAHTLAGLRLKASVVPDAWMEPDLMRSIVTDLQAMEDPATC